MILCVRRSPSGQTHRVARNSGPRDYACPLASTQEKYTPLGCLPYSSAPCVFCPENRRYAVTVKTGNLSRKATKNAKKGDSFTLGVLASWRKKTAGNRIFIVSGCAKLMTDCLEHTPCLGNAGPRGRCTTKSRRHKEGFQAFRMPFAFSAVVILQSKIQNLKSSSPLHVLRALRG